MKIVHMDVAEANMANKERLGSTRDRYYGLRDSFAGHPFQHAENGKNSEVNEASIRKVDGGKRRAAKALRILGSRK